MNLYNDKGEWSDELLTACAKLGIAANEHPEVKVLPVKPYSPPPTPPTPPVEAAAPVDQPAAPAAP